MINVDYIGRTGNNIYQYCMGRIISEKTNSNLNAKLLDFPYANFVNNNEQRKSKEVILNGHIINFDKINNTNNYHLKGFFQNYEYYKDYKNKIKEWLKIDKEYRKPEEDDLVIHVRGGDLYSWNNSYDDVNQQHTPLPLSHYVNVINNTRYDKLYIVTEYENDEIAQKIAEIFNGEIISQSIIEDYYFMLNAKKFVCSLSSLAWWACWLSDAEEIHFPLIGFWHPDSKRTDISVIVDEKRYINYDLGVYDNWTGSREEFINKMMN